ncbi:hypothetical protein Misp01_10230 [Microtetraspora sp. NBRC 13810]|uniref:hypothetical protein n=1 Tax=Microtetraspora sp. NBRC 13810 TaxID=3030990 RepID=UPI0024A4AFC7|nr:hypothetical protein [Microtetraspora sp. NBRC 13810]GLW05893.1 hypothetical protein Misp01_10230 [Microtetraspora sp. NBRC 13810]
MDRTRDEPAPCPVCGAPTGRVVVLDAGTGAVVTAFVPPARPTAIASHPDRSLVVPGGRDGSLSWDARSGHCLGRVQAHGDCVRASALAIGTDLIPRMERPRSGGCTAVVP